MAVGVRLRLLSMPLERDEGEYAYMGQLMLQGIPPYQLAFNIKMPGTYAAYAMVMALFGESASGIHLGFLFVNLGTLALLYFLARRWLDEAGVSGLLRRLCAALAQSGGAGIAGARDALGHDPRAGGIVAAVAGAGKRQAGNAVSQRAVLRIVVPVQTAGAVLRAFRARPCWRGTGGRRGRRNGACAPGIFSCLRSDWSRLWRRLA